jgi:hypothetical protein
MAAVESIQLSTSFLILSRIQVIMIPSITMSKYRHAIQYTSVCVFALSFCVVFVVTFKRAYSPKTESGTGLLLFVLIDYFTGILGCIAFACRVLGQIDDLSFYKLLIGLVNIVLGSIFVVLYFSFAQKTTIRKEKKVSLLMCVFIF